MCDLENHFLDFGVRLGTWTVNQGYPTFLCEAQVAIMLAFSFSLKSSKGAA